jgi:hypothetical protein
VILNDAVDEQARQKKVTTRIATIATSTLRKVMRREVMEMTKSQFMIAQMFWYVWRIISD